MQAAAALKLLALLPLLAPFACASSGGNTPALDAGTDASGSDALVGGFVVTLVAATLPTDTVPATPAFTAVSGKVHDAPLPATLGWKIDDEAAGCQLLTVFAPFCTPACAGTETCTPDNRCTAQPTAQDLGPVRVTGLGTSPLSLIAVAGNYQAPAGSTLPYPPAAEGAAIVVDGSGKAGPFSLRSTGITPLAFPGPVAIASDQPLLLVWAPPGRPDLTRIEVKLDISHHGGTRAQLACDVADNGTLEIPAPLITRLLGLGVAGYPTVVLSRVARGTTSVPWGMIDLRVASTVERSVSIPGLVSCTASNQCPVGQTCAADLRCQ
jgi:hypothetical protein